MLNYKLFRNGKEVRCEIIDDEDNYYNIVKSQKENGYRQLIISKEIMLNTMLECVLNRKYDIIDIITDEDKYNNELQKSLFKMKDDRAHFASIMKILNNDEIYLFSVTFKKGVKVTEIHSSGSLISESLDEDLVPVIRKSYLDYVT